MLSGKQAFRRESGVETMNAILKEDPPELTQSVPPMAPALQRIVRRCLEKKPGERFQSARDLAFALETLSVSSPSQASMVAEAPRSTHRWLVTATAGLVLLAAGVFFGHYSVPTRTLPTYQPLTLRPGTIYSANFAADGQTVLFSATFDGRQPDVYVARHESAEPQALGLAPAILLAASHTGEVAVLVKAHFIAHVQWEGTLATAHLGSGAPRELLEQVLAADYSPDGSTMAVAREVDGKIRIEYPVGKLLYETTGWVSSLRVSPDGQRLAFLDHPVRWDDRGSVLVVDREGQKRALSEGWAGVDGLTWSPSGEIWFGGNRAGWTQNTFAVTLSGKERPAMVGPDGLTVWDFARDGRLLASSGQEEHGIIFSRTGQPDRDLGWLQDSIDPYLSPDGSLMLFHDTSVGPYYTVCMRKTDGSPVTQLGPGGGGALSPDGNWAFVMFYSEPPQLRLLPIGPGEARTLERGPIMTYEFGDWMPDGKSVLFTGTEAGKRIRAYVQSISGGAPTPVTPEGIDVVPRGISPDGKWVAAINAEKKIVLYPLSGGQPIAVPGVNAGEFPIRFNGDGSALYVAHPGEYPVPVYKVDVKSGRRQFLREIMPADRSGLTPQRVDRGFIHATPDGSAFAYTYARWRGSLYLVDHSQ